MIIIISSGITSNVSDSHKKMPWFSYASVLGNSTTLNALHIYIPYVFLHACHSYLYACFKYSSLHLSHLIPTSRTGVVMSHFFISPHGCKHNSPQNSSRPKFWTRRPNLTQPNASFVKKYVSIVILYFDRVMLRVSSYQILHYIIMYMHWSCHPSHLYLSLDNSSSIWYGPSENHVPNQFFLSILWISGSFKLGISPGLIQRGAWCVRCFANGRYPETLSQRQFMKVRLKRDCKTCISFYMTCIWK